MTSSDSKSYPAPVATATAPFTRGAVFSFFRRFGIIVIALLAARLLHGQGRPWEANLLHPAHAIPGLDRAAPDSALVAVPRHAVEFRGDGAWLGVLRREGKGSSEVFAAGAAASLGFRLPTGTGIAIETSARRDRNRQVSPGELDARLGAEREALGGVFSHGLFPVPGGHGDPFLDMAVRIANREEMGFQWMLAGGRQGLWRVEYGLTQEEVLEDGRLVNLDTNGAGETVEGTYRGRVREHRLVAKAPLFGGAASLLTAFESARPRRPDQEFWFCDSSARLRGRLAYRRPLAKDPALGWGAWGDFQEAESHSIGRRIPPGSEGVKRFHFARNHALRWELGGEGFQEGPRLAWHASGRYRRLDWDSHPPEDALESRRETLSYNRLGLSFIANLYGGLFKMSELMEGRLRSGTAELDGSGTLRFGPVKAGAGVALWRAGLDLRAEGRTLEQRFLAVDTAEAFRLRYRGAVWGATPRLSATLRHRHLVLEAEMAQALPVWVDIRREGAAGGSRPAGTGDGDVFAFGRNGFAARLRLTAGY